MTRNVFQGPRSRARDAALAARPSFLIMTRS